MSRFTSSIELIKIFKLIHFSLMLNECRDKLYQFNLMYDIKILFINPINETFSFNLIYLETILVD